MSPSASCGHNRLCQVLSNMLRCDGKRHAQHGAFLSGQTGIPQILSLWYPRTSDVTPFDPMTERKYARQLVAAILGEFV